MSIVSDTIEAGGATPPAKIKVWDPFVRLFHWSLVASFVVAYATGDEIEKVHVVAGYTIAGLVAARILWGVIGPRYARFSNFVRPPGEVLHHIREMLLLRAPRYLGHNPSGGAMIIALLAALVGTCVTGYMMTTDAYWGTKWVEQVHKFFANTTVGLVAAHILGVLVASFEHRENLVASMVTGRKRTANGPESINADLACETRAGSPILDPGANFGSSTQTGRIGAELTLALSILAGHRLMQVKAISVSMCLL